MGNLSFIHPTTRIEEFDIQYIANLIKQNFVKCKVEIDDLFNQITVRDEKDDYLMEIYFGQDNYILDNDIQKTIDWISKNINTDLQDRMISDIQSFYKMIKDKDIVIQVTHTYNHHLNKLHTQIMYLICNHYEAFWLDEGIHPEMMTPEYIKSKMAKI